MQMSHLHHHPLTGFHTPSFSDYDCEDRLSATSQPTISPCPVAPYDKQPMFEKPLTPSDVGKLNRLVIPKQHAEKYFPLGGGGGGDSAGGLLGFEDEAGKCWQFRYSYWNSSQSYVLTKGWSRYVKEKGLDAGDVVFFEHHRAEPSRLFIGWRRRGTPPAQPPPGFSYNAPLGLPLFQSDRRSPAESGGGTAKEEGEEQARTRTPSAAAGINNTNNSTRLVRLFGVDLECSHQTTSSQVSPQPIQPQQQHQEAFRNYFNYMGHHHHHHHMLMDMDSTQGVNQTGNRPLG